MKGHALTVKFDVASQISEVCQLLDSQGLEAICTELQQLRDEIIQLRCSVVVVGEFKRGKSTFLNALLGRAILPADILPATATVNRVTWGIDPKVSIHYHDGTVRDDLAIEQLSTYVTKLTDESSLNAAQIKEAVVAYPLRFCREGCDLIDTPGLQDEAAMTMVTNQVLQSVDVAMLIVMADMPFSQTEANLLERLLISQVSHIVVIMNGIDRIRKQQDRERLLGDIQDRVRAQVQRTATAHFVNDVSAHQDFLTRYADIKVIPVSAIDALEGREENDPALLQQSKFEEVEAHLDLIVQSSDKLALRAKLQRCMLMLNEGIEAFQQLKDASFVPSHFLLEGMSLLCERLLNHVEQQILEYRTDLKMMMIQQIEQVSPFALLLAKVEPEIQFHVPVINQCKAVTDAVEMQKIANQLTQQIEKVTQLLLDELGQRIVKAIQSQTETMNEMMAVYTFSLKTMIDELHFHGYTHFDAFESIEFAFEAIDLKSASVLCHLSPTVLQQIISHETIQQEITEASTKNSFFRVVTFDFDEPGDIWYRHVSTMIANRLREQMTDFPEKMEPTLRTELQTLLLPIFTIIEQVKKIQRRLLEEQHTVKSSHLQNQQRHAQILKRLQEIQQDVSEQATKL